MNASPLTFGAMVFILFAFRFSAHGAPSSRCNRPSDKTSGEETRGRRLFLHFFISFRLFFCGFPPPSLGGSSSSLLPQTLALLLGVAPSVRLPHRPGALCPRLRSVWKPPRSEQLSPQTEPAGALPKRVRAQSGPSTPFGPHAHNQRQRKMTGTRVSAPRAVGQSRSPPVPSHM